MSDKSTNPFYFECKDGTGGIHRWVMWDDHQFGHIRCKCQNCGIELTREQTLAHPLVVEIVYDWLVNQISDIAHKRGMEV